MSLAVDSDHDMLAGCSSSGCSSTLCRVVHGIPAKRLGPA
jgi:hypothetical protein